MINTFGGDRYFRQGCFFRGGGGGGRYFRTLLAARKKIDVNFGGSLLWELYGSLEMNHRYGLFYSPILFAFVSDVLNLF